MVYAPDDRCIRRTHHQRSTDAQPNHRREQWRGEDFSDYYLVPEKVLQEAREQNANWGKKVVADYAYSLYVRGDNTLANAEAAGAIDGRKLYPDIPYPEVEEETKAFYADPKALEYAFPEEVLLDVLKPE
ncbi:hypothetical protein ONZ45_g17783 [Pleurotus djamor]|nr:hypothetical protein ONZ45_g17783 [Pleurotus djamor]